MLSAEAAAQRKDQGWVVLRGAVYALGPFAELHPGGDYVIRDVFGTDAGGRFNSAGHSDRHADKLKPYLLGKLGDPLPAETAAPRPPQSQPQPQPPAKRRSSQQPVPKAPKPVNVSRHQIAPMRYEPPSPTRGSDSWCGVC